MESLEVAESFALPVETAFATAVYRSLNYSCLQLNVSEGPGVVLRGPPFAYTVVRHMGLCVTMTEDLQRVTTARACVQLALSLPGLVGAALSLRVSSLRRNRTSLTVQVALLSLYDLLYLSMVLLLSVMHLAGVRHRAISGALQVVRITALWCLTYTLVDISVQRCLAIDRPLLARKVCHVSLTLKRAAAILVAGLILVAPFVLDLIFSFSTSNDECQHWRLNLGERRLTDYGVVYTLYLFLTLFFLLPFTVIIVVNGRLVYALARFAKRHHSSSSTGFTSPTVSSFSSTSASALPSTAALSATSLAGVPVPLPPPPSPAETSARQLSLFVVGMSLWYGLCMVLPSVAFLVRLARVELFRPQREMVAVAVVDCLVVASAAFNFLFYFLLWRQFRRTFLALFCGSTCHGGEGDPGGKDSARHPRSSGTESGESARLAPLPHANKGGTDVDSS